MQLDITSSDVAIRLILTFVAGAIIGVNRGERGRPAGFRTTILVCLTASASMILGNLLLNTSGGSLDSIVRMDVMRLPLGILTGMGFIGAGAILHRGNAVTGVTTAATLWFTTLMGFCFGSGQHLLGAWMLGLGVFILWCLEWIEARWKQQQEATLIVSVDANGPSQSELTAAVETNGERVTSAAVRHSSTGSQWRFEVAWRSSQKESSLPEFVNRLAERPGVKEVRWMPTLKS